MLLCIDTFRQEILENVASNTDITLWNSITISLMRIFCYSWFSRSQCPHLLRTVITIANGKDSITFKVLFLQSVKCIYLSRCDWLLEHVKKKKAQRCLTRFSFVITKYRLFNMLFYDQLWYITSVFLFLWNNLTLFNEVMLKSTLVSIVLTLYHSKTGQSRFFIFHYYNNTCCNRNNGRVWICNRTAVTLNIKEINITTDHWATKTTCPHTTQQAMTVGSWYFGASLSKL